LNIDELVGENVRRARVAAGLSSHELAHRVTGVGLPLTESALLRLEGGEDRLGVDELIALGLALGMPPAMLLSPLNLGSLLWVDAEGRPMASWALFHDDARSFSPPGQEGLPQGAGRALGVATVPAGPAGEPPPPPPPNTPLASPIETPSAEPPASPAPIPSSPRENGGDPLQPAPVPEMVGAAAAAVRPPPLPAMAEAPAAPLRPPPLPAMAAATTAPHQPPPAGADDPATAAGQDTRGADPVLLPPDPMPTRKPKAGLRENGEPSPHRAWAIEALQALQAKDT